MLAMIMESNDKIPATDESNQNQASALHKLQAESSEREIKSNLNEQNNKGVTVIVRSRASDAEIDETMEKVARRERAPLSDSEFEQRFGADPAAMQKVRDFARANKLIVKEENVRSGKMYLSASAEELGTVFHVDLAERQGIVPRGKDGVIQIPDELKGSVYGIFGLEKERKAVPHISRENSKIAPLSSRFAFYPDEVADFYKFPKEAMGAGQSVAILQFGGGLNKDDNAAYYDSHNYKKPEIQLLGVDGASNQPGGSDDDEVALDSQIIGVIAPEAKQQIIFAENTDQGFIDAIGRATFPEEGELQNTSISLSWGSPESTWAPETMKSIDRALKFAAMKGISVFVAAGDNGAVDRSRDGRFNVDFPASSPWVTSVGGTRIYSDKDHEVVWNEGGMYSESATGGGVSEVFPLPQFQQNAGVPLNANNTGKTGRGVPDIAGNAANNSGYLVRVDGHETVRGGTSAAAPLYAALVMRTNSAIKQPVGYLNPFLYKQENQNIFRDITEGKNNGYTAGKGWDATSGLGSVNGEKFLFSLRKELKR